MLRSSGRSFGPSPERIDNGRGPVSRELSQTLHI